MTNEELKKILDWAEKRNFTWADLQKQFDYDNQKMVSVQNTLRSNMPASNNLVDHHYVSGENPNLLVITVNGRKILAELKNQKSSLWNFFNNPWIVGVGLLILTIILKLLTGQVLTKHLKQLYHIIINALSSFFKSDRVF